MKITRKSLWSGIKRTREIDVTPEQMERFEKGEFIQNVMPNISDSDREFILSGMIDQEWDELYGEEETRTRTIH